MTKELGKIREIKFGFGGYDEAMIGLTITLGGDNWGTSDFKGTWADRSDHAQWTEESQIALWGEAVKFLRDLLRAAKCKSITDLHDTPVEVTFEENKLKSWRVLTEVI